MLMLTRIFDFKCGTWMGCKYGIWDGNGQAGKLEAGRKKRDGDRMRVLVYQPGEDAALDV